MRTTTIARDPLGDFKKWIDARTATDPEIAAGERTVRGSRYGLSTLCQWMNTSEAQILRDFHELEPMDLPFIRMFSYMDPTLRDRVIAGEDPRPTKVMFCSREDGEIAHFYPSQIAVRFCFGPRDVYQILKIELVADPEGAFWCWHCFERNNYGMVYPDPRLLGMCFPYGLDSAEAVGHGVRVQVRVDVLDENPAPEERRSGRDSG